MRSQLNRFAAPLSLYALMRPSNLDIQIAPNYMGRFTQAEILDKLPTIDFEGPGWYFVKSPSGKKIDSVLIVADMKKPNRLWKKLGWHHKVKFLVFAWVNHDASSTLQLLNQAPVRRDDRD